MAGATYVNDELSLENKQVFVGLKLLGGHELVLEGDLLVGADHQVHVFATKLPMSDEMRPHSNSYVLEDERSVDRGHKDASNRSKVVHLVIAVDEVNESGADLTNLNICTHQRPFKAFATHQRTQGKQHWRKCSQGAQ